MSHYMTALAMKQTGLKPATKIVLYWLADHHNETTGDCFPSIRRLAELCEMDRATVIRQINALEANSIVIRVERKRSNGSQTSNGYKLMLQNATPPVVNCDPPLPQNCDPLNLVSNNLGNINNINAQMFDEFWKAYPKKMAKGQAKKAWAKAFLLDHPQEIIDAAKRYAKSQEGKDKQFIPYPASWLNAERWKDEPEEQKAEIVNMAAVFLKGEING